MITLIIHTIIHYLLIIDYIFLCLADIFIQVAEAFKILTDPAAKAAFDKVLKAKEKAKLRTQAYDVKRRKFKDGNQQML